MGSGGSSQTKKRSEAAPARTDSGNVPPGDADAAATTELTLLNKVDVLKRLPEADRPNLIKALKDADFAPGEVIITQGEDGNAFFVIRSGVAKVEVNGAHVGELKTGDYFGELSLIRNEPRMATITAVEKTCTKKISREDFINLGLIEKLEFPTRRAVGGAMGGEVKTQEPTTKTEDDRKLMSLALMDNKNLPEVYDLDETKCNKIIDLMWDIKIEKGKAIIEKGDLEADYFYIVKEGSFNIEIDNEDGQSAGAAVHAGSGVVKKGESFGELALMYFAPRAATLTAAEDSELWVIDRNQFKDIFVKSSDEIMLAHVRHIEKVDALKALKDTEKQDIAKALSDMTFVKGETIFAQGDPGDCLYILIEGVVKVVKDGQEAETLTAKGDDAKIFGELALLNKSPRAASIIVESEVAKALTIDKISFDMLIGSLEQINLRGKDGTTEVKKAPRTSIIGENRFGKIMFSDLNRLGLLGCGGFGAVHLVEHTKDNKTYALKALSKGYVVKTGMQSSVIAEKEVQLMCDSPFIVKLFETYNGTQTLYLLLELALGGELYATYNKKQLWGREDCAKFYVAGTTFAFEHLHARKVVFRDLKPENLLLNEKGEVKLTDMGLAKVVVGKTTTTCGTPDYFAPEIIASKGHAHGVDWWTLGILSFELMIGHPPFESATPMQIYKKVKKGINKVNFPKKCPQSCEDFIKALCHGNPSERLPMRKGGTKNIKSHPWFEGFDWTAMEEVKMTPPYLPKVKSTKDIGNFSASEEDLPPQVSYKDPGTGWDKDFATCK
jgi:cGMP-dependent protein kinase